MQMQGPTNDVHNFRKLLPGRSTCRSCIFDVRGRNVPQIVLQIRNAVKNRFFSSNHGFTQNIFDADDDIVNCNLSTCYQPFFFFLGGVRAASQRQK